MIKIVKRDIFLKQILIIQNNYLIFIEIYHFYLKNKKLKNLFVAQKTKKYLIPIRALKQALNHGLVSKKVHRIIQFKQKAWLKSYIDMNTELRKKAQNEFEKNFFKLINNSAFEKTMENVRNHRYIKLLILDKRRKRLVSEPNYHSLKNFSEHSMTIETKKIRVNVTKPLYLGMSMLDISKILMYEFQYDYINPKYGDRAKLCYTDTDSFIIYIKTEYFFEDISNDIFNDGLIHLTTIKMIKDIFQQVGIKKYPVF